MINYSILSQRFRRIINNYLYCVDHIYLNEDQKVTVQLKDDYQLKNGEKSFVMHDGVEAITLFKGVIRPAGKSILVALYGFNCKMCGTYIRAGQNYVDLDGTRVCTACGLS